MEKTVIIHRKYEKVENALCVISPSGHCRIRDSNNWVTATHYSLKNRMVYCGSGLFQVAFSSVAIFSAIYSHFLLKTYISNMQWLGILVVTFGLCISPLSGSTVTGSPYIGICLTLLGAQFYALSYIVNEMILVRASILSLTHSESPAIKEAKKSARTWGCLIPSCVFS